MYPSYFYSYRASTENPDSNKGVFTETSGLRICTYLLLIKLEYCISCLLVSGGVVVMVNQPIRTENIKFSYRARNFLITCFDKQFAADDK